MEYGIKKLFNGFASVRDYVVKDCIKQMEDLVISYQGKKMTIPLKRLTNPFQLHKTTMKSKFNKQTYELFDFRFVPDGEEPPPTKKEVQIKNQQKLF